MSDYVSTRGGPSVPLSEAVFRGLAPDGGLYVPTGLPHLSLDAGATPAWTDAAFPEVARRIAPLFFPSLPVEVVGRVTERALAFPVPLVEVEPGRFVLELFHGPTSAFKDVGARFMAALMPELEEGREGPGRTVLVATSGDTGGAVASAFHGIPGYRVVVLFPLGGISRRQRAQMTTLGDNVVALAVHGTFDDCQRMVKRAFGDPEVRRAHRLTSANSINIARLLPQAFYYVHAALQLGAPRFVVPSGNLGNLCAGLLAARAGMPTAGFVAATNANREFADFLGGADFVPRGSVPTSSSAMDVGAPSNLERLRWLYGGDDGKLRRAVAGHAVVDDAVVARRIATVYESTGYIMDPHTAVAYEAAVHHDGAAAPMVILSTAHPAKFPETVEAAIDGAVPVPRTLLLAESRQEHMIEIEPTDDALREALAEAPTDAAGRSDR